MYLCRMLSFYSQEQIPADTLRMYNRSDRMGYFPQEGDRIATFMLYVSQPGDMSGWTNM